MAITDAALFQAQSYLDIGQPRRALDVLGEALRADPDNATLLAHLAWAHLKAGDDAAASEAAVAAQTASGRPVAQAMIVQINVAHHRHDHREVCEIARAFVAQWPQAYNGHVWYALGLAQIAATEHDRGLVRHAMATALDLGGRTPELLLNAAWIESRFGHREACLALVDEGLAADPSNADLLKLRAWAVKDSTYSAKVMMGILAIDPMDAGASRSLESEVEPRRARLVRLVFLTPFWLALAVLVAPGTPRAVAIAVVVLLLVARAVPPARFLRALPASYVRSRWHGQGPNLVASASVAVVGAALFALDLPVVGPLVMAVGVALWGRATIGEISHRAASEPDGPSRDLLLEAHAVWSRHRTAIACLVGGMAGLGGWEYLRRVDAGALAAPLFTVVLLAGVTVVSCMLLLSRIGRRRSATGTVVSALVMGVVGVGMGVIGAIGVVDSTTGPEAGRYQNLPPGDICRRGRCYDITPDLPPPPSLSPVPTISIPPFTMPTFDAPDVPDLDGLTEPDR